MHHTYMMCIFECFRYLFLCLLILFCEYVVRHYPYSYEMMRHPSRRENIAEVTNSGHSCIILIILIVVIIITLIWKKCLFAG